MTSVIQTSLAAGEVAPSLYGAVDLAKYHAGLALCENAFVNYQGGVSNRTGTEFIGYAADAERDVILIPFQFKTTQTYILEFSHQLMRVIKDGGFVLKDPVQILGIANSVVTVAAGHGIVSGDTVVLDGINGMPDLNGATARAGAVTSTTITLERFDGSAFPTPGTYGSGGTISPYFTLATPYHHSHLFELKYVQSADVLTITHREYAMRDLTREGHANWTLTEIELGSKIDPPTLIAPMVDSYIVTDPAVTQTQPRLAYFSYIITSVTKDGEESIASYRIDTNPVTNISAEAGTITIAWNGVRGADGYNVYKALPSLARSGAPNPDDGIPAGVSFGFVGFVKGTSFADSNVLPDFSTSPPTHFDPFADGAIVRVNITNQGAGYDQDSARYAIITSTGFGAILEPVVDMRGHLTAAIVVKQGENYRDTDTVTFINGGQTAPGPGSGASATAVLTGDSVTSVIVTAGGSGYVNPQVFMTLSSLDDQAVAIATQSGGVIVSIAVLTPGFGYTSPPTVSIFDGSAVTGGIDAVGEVEASPLTGNWPGAVAYFQQRKCFASSSNSPVTIWMSQPGLFDNFDVSRPLKDDDSITADLVSKQVNDIKYMVEMPGGLITLTGGGNAWQISGGGQHEPISPLSIMADPQAYTGCADLVPITINYDILYVQEKGSIVRDLAYNFFTNIYTGEDISVVSNHLVSGFRLRQWAWAEEPHKVVWTVREDGHLLSLTFLKEQKVQGWAKSHTKGLFRSVATIQEDNEDAMYLVVRRMIGGQWYQFVERTASRSMPYGAEDAWFVDAGLRSVLEYPNQTLTADGVSGTVQFVAGNPVFTPTDVGRILRMGGGIAEITQFIHGQRVIGVMRRPIDQVIRTADPDEPFIPLPAGAREWSLSTPTTVFSGLDHLEGEWLSILADGSVAPRQQVVNGSITLLTPATKVLAGIPYSSRIQTLKLDTGEPTIQGSKKKISSVTIRVDKTRGIWVGPQFDMMRPVKDRNGESYGSPIPLFSGDIDHNMDPLWNTEGQVCVLQPDPLPMTILAFVPDVQIGDNYNKFKK